MGMYCCCGVKITRDSYKCKCDWEGWTTFKGDKTPLDPPKKDGLYLVRVCDNGGDRFEIEWEYSVKPLERVVICYKDNVVFEKHWEGEMWDDYHVYAWKEIKNRGEILLKEDSDVVEDFISTS